MIRNLPRWHIRHLIMICVCTLTLAACASKPLSPYTADTTPMILLPARQALISWLGAPIESTDHISDLVYKFQLQGAQADSGLARIDMDYDPAGNRPLAIEASFARYSASIDVPEGTLRMKLY